MKRWMWIPVSLFLIIGAGQAYTAAQWAKSGSVLGGCLLECGVNALDSVVTDWAGGEAISGEAIGWSSLPCVIACAGKAGATLVAHRPDTYSDSVGATMTPLMKFMAAPPPGVSHIDQMCGKEQGGEPMCKIVIQGSP